MDECKPLGSGSAAGAEKARVHNADMTNVDPTDSVRWAALEAVRSGRLDAKAVWSVGRGSHSSTLLLTVALSVAQGVRLGVV